MTLASFRAAAEHAVRQGRLTPHQLAALQAAWERSTPEQQQAFSDDWRAEGSPAAPAPAAGLGNLQSWLTFLTGPEVSRLSKNKISPLTAAEACGFIGCVIVETGRPMLDQLDVVEEGSGAGRGAMQYTGVRRTAYDKARSAAIAKKLDPNSNAWQQQYFAEEYAGLHDPSQGSLIGWTKVFEDRPDRLDPAKAAAYFTEVYFRPGVPHVDRRKAEAQRVWKLIESKQLSAQKLPELQQQKQTAAVGKVAPSSSFSTLLTAHVRLGEFALDQEARRFDHQHQVNTAAELAAFLERCRTQFGNKPIIITSGYRPPAVNRSVGGASSSEHLFNAPNVGAVDFYIKGASTQAVQDWCDKNWPYSLGYGAAKGFVHLGIRAGRPRVRWDY